MTENIKEVGTFPIQMKFLPGWTPREIENVVGLTPLQWISLRGGSIYGLHERFIPGFDHFETKHGEVRINGLPVEVTLIKGEGIKDVWGSIKERFSVIGKTRKDMPPSSRRVLEKDGDKAVVAGYVTRKPLNKVLEKIIKLTTSITYDKLFHLATVWKLSDGTYVVFQKNEVVDLKEVSPSFVSDREYIMIPGVREKGLTLREIVDTTRNQMQEKFFSYSPTNNNCQLFVKNTLEANNFPVDEKFILQDVYNDVSQPVSKLFKKVTDIASAVNQFVQGSGLQTILFDRSIWNKDDADKWLKKHKYADFVDVKKNYLRYRQEEPIYKKYRTKLIYHKGKPIELVLGYF